MAPSSFQLKRKEQIIHPQKISCTSGNRNPEKVSYVSCRERFSCILEDGNPEKVFYISGDGTFRAQKKTYFLRNVTFQPQA